MKKFFLAITTALLIAGTAFAGGKDGFEAGITYGTLATVNKDDAKIHTDISGWGFELGYYESVIPFVGVQANAFFMFPDSIKAYASNGTSTDLSGLYKAPFVMSAEAMLMVNIPITIIDLRVGAGIGYTLHAQHNNLLNMDYYNHYLTVPVSAAVVLHLGALGLKAGCDINFAFSAWQTYENNSTELPNTTNYIVVLPHIAVTLKM